MTYNAAGALTNETYGNGAVHSVNYNNRLQPTQISLTAANTVIQQYNYNYGTVDQTTGTVDTTKNNGKVGSVDAFIGGTPSTPVKQWQERFSYDSLGRLDIASEYRSDNNQLTWRADYDYDQYGNRLQLPAGQSQNLNVNYTTVQSSDINAQTNRFTSGINYDPAGNITQDAKFHNQQYAYDANGRVKTSNPIGGAQATATYDGLGQMVRTQVGSTTQTIVYDLYGRVAAEYQNGSLQKWYIYRGAGKDVIAVVDKFAGGAKRYVMSDRLGSKRVVMDASANILSRRDYLPYGEEIAAGVGMRQVSQGYGNGDVVRERYATMLTDDVSGLDHTLWRKFDKTSGRWTSPDPTRKSRRMNDPQSFNRYAYVHNDPVNFVDPSGLNAQAPGGGGGNCWYRWTATGWFDENDDLIGVTDFSGSLSCSGGGGISGDTGGGGGEIDPENPPFDVPGITNLVNQELADPDCAKFAETILNELSNGKGGSLADVFKAFLNQPKAHDLFTRTAPPGSRGEATAIGSLNNSTAAMFLRRDPNQTVNDANGVIAELFHFAGGPYSDRDLARALNRTAYASDAQYAFPDGTANIFDEKNYRPNGWSDADGYSTYFHAIQQRYCGTKPPNTYRNP